MKIILASGSPRRQELLKNILEEFEIIPSKCEERIPDGCPAEESAEFLAVQKAMDVEKEHKGDLVIGCDTVVVCDSEILGKPKNEEDAKRMLRKLSGKEHKVITGTALMGNGISISFSETTSVKFAPMTDEEIDWYISTKEPMDKAGAYGIQGYGSLFIEKITGDYYSVMGLSVNKLYSFFKKICPEALKTMGKKDK